MGRPDPTPSSPCGPDCTGGRPYYPDIWASAEVLHGEQLVGNGSSSKSVTDSRTIVLSAICRCAAHPVRAA